ncbi:hypothetical protein CHS0354_001997 [Potamilus streckersoni]|uniref:Protein GrpE n=1 Tax=Potamilus streckersoni TaxID=2493646 RepID=A0AAE0T6E1_9BIVA|nr:hypothetical protein CHS0354_001997 [Potamilus streckersoni]
MTDYKNEHPGDGESNPREHSPDDDMNSDKETHSADTGEGQDYENTVNGQSRDTDGEECETDSNFEKLRAENNELKDRLMRQAAEFENFRKRNRTETENKLKYSIQPFCKDLLPGLDNLERARAAAVEASADNGFIEGIEMVYKHFLQTFEKYGVSRMESKNKPFDPNVHEAMGTVVSERRRKITWHKFYAKVICSTTGRI